LQLFVEYVTEKPSEEMVRALQTICANHHDNQELFRNIDGFQVLERVLTSLQFSQLKIATIETIPMLCQDNHENLDFINKTVSSSINVTSNHILTKNM
jgi:hypothetical protein